MTAKSLYDHLDVQDLNKTLFIVRGVPGSGQSSIANIIADEMYSVDDYFYTIGNGNYEFNKTDLKEAYEQCYQNVISAMGRNVNRVAVHNPFVKRKDYHHYLKMAKKFKYNVFVIICDNKYDTPHKLPERQLKSMKIKFEADQ